MVSSKSCHPEREETLVLRVLVPRKRLAAVNLQVGVPRLKDGAHPPIRCLDGAEVASQSRYDHGEIRTGARWPPWSLMYPQIMQLAVANRASLLAVTMVVGLFSFL